MEDPLVDSEILHSGEGGDVERWLEPRNKSFVFAIDFLLLFIALHFYLVIYLVCTSLLHPFITCISRSLLITTRKQLRASTYNLEESKRRSSRALHGEFGFNSCFE